MAGLRYPSHGRLRQTEIRPSAEGRSNWLYFLRKTLSFSIPNRFIPAHPDPPPFPTAGLLLCSNVLPKSGRPSVGRFGGVRRPSPNADPRKLRQKRITMGGRGWAEQSEGNPGVSSYRSPTPATHPHSRSYLPRPDSSVEQLSSIVPVFGLLRRRNEQLGQLFYSVGLRSKFFPAETTYVSLGGISASNRS